MKPSVCRMVCVGQLFPLFDAPKKTRRLWAGQDYAAAIVTRVSTPALVSVVVFGADGSAPERVGNVVFWDTREDAEKAAGQSGWHAWWPPKDS